MNGSRRFEVNLLPSASKVSNARTGYINLMTKAAASSFEMAVTA
jgi:hypothetical protein